MKPKVPGVGPADARIVLIGEAPGKTEVASGEPFTGMSGNLQNRWWTEVGIARQSVRIDNLYPYMPPGGKIDAVAADTLAYYVSDLRERIASLENPYVVVPTGNYATFALTGKGKVKASLRKALGEDITATEAERKAGITKLRGSVYAYQDLRGRWMKVIPTIHPAWFLYAGGFNSKKQRRAYTDWRRIRREATSPEVVRRERVHLVNPLEQEVSAYLEFVEGNPELIISIDIETWGNTLSCVGFSHSPNYSITIPTASKKQREVFLPYVKALCGTRNPKATHAGHFDTYWLAYEDIFLTNWCWDTLAMHHALFPTDEQALHFISSLYCPDYTYWKDEAKDAEEIIKYVRDLDALYTYNGLDCCYTRELVDYLYGELRQANMLNFYTRHYAELFYPILDVMLEGVRVDTDAQKKWAAKLRKACRGTRKELEELAGTELWAAKDFSPKKLREYFASVGTPKSFRTRKNVASGKVKTESLDEAALRGIATRRVKPRTQTREQWEESKKAARLLLRHRRDIKVAQFMKGAWDGDGRIRCQYKFQTEAGRFASSKNPRRTGYNLQNVDREIRATFVPNEGCVFVKVDLSQIEDRIVKMWTRSDRLVELANLRPDEFDCHRFNAAQIFEKEESDITYDERYLGKRVVHAAERGMAGKRLSETLLNDFDMVITPAECQGMIDKFFAAFPEIPEVYFPTIREDVMAFRRLVSNWGRVWTCEFDRFDEDLYRRAYSFNPQADAADWLNQWGFKPLWNMLRDAKMRSRINLQVHDEVIVSCPPQEAYIVALFVVSTLEQPRFYFGNRLVVPACVTVAKDWKDDRFEFKRLPGRPEFDEAVYKVLEEVGNG